MAENIEKAAPKKRRKKTVTMTVPNIPLSVHKRIIQYGRSIAAQRERKYNVVESYCEFLIEHAKVSA